MQNRRPKGMPAFEELRNSVMKRFPILTKFLAKPIKLGRIISMLLLALIVSSCGMVNEDMIPCGAIGKNITIVDFQYTYNMSKWQTGQEEDWFDSHAGSVYLYIFDEDGIYLDRREKHKSDFAPGEDFTMTFSDKELLPGATYDFVAVAQGNTLGYVENEDYQWFKLINPMVPGLSKIEDYILKLDRDTNEDGFSEIGVINYKDQYGQNQQMIDTLWTTKPDEVQRVTINPPVEYKLGIEDQPDNITRVTVPMMRITNAITVNLHSNGFSKDTDPGIYHVVIYFPNGNGTVDFTGDISQSAQQLYYQSLIKQMVPYITRASGGEIDSGNVNRYTLQSKFGVSRLMLGDESTLQIRDATKEGNPILVELPFTDYLASLAQGNFDDPQEFLDREYDYQLDLTLNDDVTNWVGLEISVNILGWAKRIQNVDL